MKKFLYVAMLAVLPLTAMAQHEEDTENGVVSLAGREGFTIETKKGDFVFKALNRRFVVFFHNHRGIMFESFYIVSWLWATTNIDNIQLRNKKESKIHRIFIFRCGLCVKASEI